MHYGQQRRASMPLCLVEGCQKQAVNYDPGLCAMHYDRLREYGSTDDPHRTTEERFWAFVNKTDTCWLWTGARERGGYGRFALTHHKGVLAHRFAYELLIGPIPEELDLDHVHPRCTHKHCVNPAHLEPVTRGENNRRRSAVQTHCKRGHKFTPENTYRAPGSPIIRRCRECQRIYQQAQNAKRRAGTV